MIKPRIFISHCEKNFHPTDYAIRIIDALGCTPVIAEKQPKLSKNIPSLIQGTLDSCDAAIIIATPGAKQGRKNIPSRGVLIEIGMIQKKKKFRNKYAIIKEESVELGPMVSEAYYTFSGNNFGPLAEAILTELYSMGLYKNYCALPGNDHKLHELMEALTDLKKLKKQNIFTAEVFKSHVEKLIRSTVEKIIR